MALIPVARRCVGHQGPTPRRRTRKTAPVVRVPPPTLAAQKSDFTAEGSPPPGLVGTAPPEVAPDPDPPRR